MNGRRLAFGLMLILTFLISVVMLFTDKNLQSDFGVLQSVPPYYLHWYGVAAMAVLDLIAGLILLGLGASPSMAARSPRGTRLLTLGALAWTILAIVAMVGIVATYSQVGFQNAMQFAQYLFGVTAYPNTLAYIPWLYDLLLVAYLVTAALGAMAFLELRRPAPAAPA